MKKESMMKKYKKPSVSYFTIIGWSETSMIFLDQLIILVLLFKFSIDQVGSCAINGECGAS